MIHSMSPKIISFILLKIKDESNSSYFELIPIDKTHLLILSWFFSTKRFKKWVQTWVIWVNSNIIKKKCAVKEGSVNEHTIGNRVAWESNRFSVLSRGTETEHANHSATKYNEIYLYFWKSNSQTVYCFFFSFLYY